MHKIFTLIAMLAFITVNAQQLNCTVVVNADRVGATNNQIFKTLETSLNDFVNRTDWSGEAVSQNEKINCSMFINITEMNGNQFTASIQVQSARPVYNSTYSSPILNFNDLNFNFSYTEFQNLNYNPTAFESNLVSVISFYSFVMLGMDADTFSPGGGSGYLDMAREIMIVAQQSGFKGWNQADGNQTRYFLITDMLSQTFYPFRDAMYQYHFAGLDMMAQDLTAAKENIKNSLVVLSEINNVRPNSFLSRVFFDAKSDEIVSIFSGGPSVPITDLVDNLNRISPLNSSKWSQIRF
ncbi:MAG: DUF4835 family protein [Flavobacterium sp.]|nr:DUF4835 family protein [Flavobacterium sp.]